MTDPFELMANDMKRLVANDFTSIEEAGGFFARWGHAVANVIDLHKPEPYGDTQICRTCSDGQPDAAVWPCPTVRAIATALEAK